MASCHKELYRCDFCPFLFAVVIDGWADKDYNVC